LQGTLKPLLAIAAFVALFVFNLPFPLVVTSAGIIGYVGARFFSASQNTPIEPDLDVTVRPGTLCAALACLLLWIGTLAALHAVLGDENVFTQIASFFSKMALITFGGAYAVLSYVAQQGVEHYAWLQPGEMLDGLAMAETTPGPLILVTQFVGFLAALRDGLQPSLLAATAGAVLTLWVTFLPCFLWIFAGAPYVEKLRGHRALSAALAAITAAVVGVIANLALWFALNALFAENSRLTGYGVDLLIPKLASVNLPLVGISMIAFMLVFIAKVRVLPLLGACATMGIGWTLLSSAGG
jgi:chromate transporter